MKATKTADVKQEKILFSPSRVSVNEFFVKNGGREYFGTKEALYAQMGLTLPQFSQTPFIKTQELTQKNLNDFLSIPTIATPTLPAPLNLVKDEFESKAEFGVRVQNATLQREKEIQRLQEQYRQNVEVRNAELENRKANIQTKKKEYLLKNFALVMGEPIISNPVYNPETDTMFVNISMNNAEWKKKVAITIKERNEARELTKTLSEYQPIVEVSVQNDTFVFDSIKIIKKGLLSSKKYQATLSEQDYKPEHIAVTLEDKKSRFQ